MAPWERYSQPASTAPAAPAAPVGPWSKFAERAAAPAETKWRDPGMIVPLQFSDDGPGAPASQWRFATPQIVTETVKALEAPGKAMRGDYGWAADEQGTVRPDIDAMIPDAMGLASLALTPLNPAAKAGASFGANVIKPGANRILRRELEAAQIPFNEVPSRLSSIGKEAMLLDLSPGLRARAAAVATMPGEGQKTVVDALTTRRAGSNLRIQGDIDETLGPAPIPSQLADDNLASRSSLSPEYQALFRDNAVAVNSEPIALDLDSMIVNMRGAAQKRAKEVRGMLNVAGNEEYLDPNPATLFETRNAIDGMLATETDPKAVGVLKYIRTQVDNMVAEAVPGIKDVDAKYAELARQGEAAQTGQQLLDTGRTAPRPAEVESMMRDGALPQGAQIGPSAVPLRLSQGARSEIDRIVGTNVRDINAMKRIVSGEGTWNRDRLVSVFGQEKADRLFNILEREATYNSGEEMALSGSRTQVLKAAQEDIAGVGPRANPVRSAANFRFGDAVADTADRTLGWISRAQRGATNDSLASALTAGPDNLQTLAALSRSPVSQPVQASSLNALRLMALQLQ